jgi:hypothetical protein
MRFLAVSVFASLCITMIRPNALYIINDVKKETSQVEALDQQMEQLDRDFDDESQNIDEKLSNFDQLSVIYEEMNKIYDGSPDLKLHHSDKLKKLARKIKHMQSLFASNSDKLVSIGREMSGKIVAIDDEEMTTVETDDDDYYTLAPDVVYDFPIENERFVPRMACGFYVKDESGKFLGLGCESGKESVTLIDEFKFKCIRLEISRSSHTFVNCSRVDSKRYSPVTAEDLDMESYNVDDLLTSFFIPKSKDGKEIACENFKFRIRTDVYASGCREKSLDYPRIVTFHDRQYKCEDGSDMDDDFFIYGLCEEVSAQDTTTLEPPTTEPLPNMKKWVKMCERSTRIPEHAVIGGKDHDGSPFYVIRKKVDDEYLFGRFVESESKVGFVTNEEEEIELSDFEVRRSV